MLDEGAPKLNSVVLYILVFSFLSSFLPSFGHGIGVITHPATHWGSFFSSYFVDLFYSIPLQEGVRMSFVQTGRFAVQRTLQNLKVGTGSVKLGNVKKIITQASCDPSRFVLSFNWTPLIAFQSVDLFFFFFHFAAIHQEVLVQCRAKTQVP
jgi:hypothetical protein